MTALAGWQNFYEIVGSSAGALIGLQFVAMSLITNMPSARIDPQAGGAFATPTIIHFGTVLALAGLLSAPWEGIGPPMVIFGLVGLNGVAYTVIVVRRMRRQKAYKPEFEDWLFHVLLPFAAYATLAGSAYAARTYPHEALFGTGAAVLLLLFIGIHNAWDAVTYHVYVKSRDRDRNR
jgi:hypothetical protein